MDGDNHVRVDLIAEQLAGRSPCVAQSSCASTQSGTSLKAWEDRALLLLGQNPQPWHLGALPNGCREVSAGQHNRKGVPRASHSEVHRHLRLPVGGVPSKNLKEIP